MLSVASRAVLDACERLGLDTNDILSKSGLERAIVYAPDARLPSDKADAVWRNAYAAAGDPRLALHAAEALPFGAFKVIDFVVANAPTVGEGLSRVARYFVLLDRRGTLEIIEGEPMRLRMTAVGGTVPPPAQEFTLAAVALRSRTSAGMPWPLRQVELAFDAPDDVSELERVFGCPVRFGAPHPELVIDGAVWTAPVEKADPTLLAVLDDHAKRLIAELPAGEPSLGSQLRRVLHEQLRGGDTSVATVAKRLGFGERTLQRRLKELDIAYADVLSEIRGSLAREYLRDPAVSLAEAAWLLGFAEQSTFTRAFKRWTGQTPGQWRARHDDARPH